MVEEMQHCFEGMLSTMMKDVNEKMGIMQARMDEKDGVIKNLKVRMDSKDGNIKDLKVTIKDMKARMDEKDDFTEGLQADADALRHDLQKERKARREDIDALREVRQSLSYHTLATLKLGVQRLPCCWRLFISGSFWTELDRNSFKNFNAVHGKNFAVTAPSIS